MKTLIESNPAMNIKWAEYWLEDLATDQKNLTKKQITIESPLSLERINKALRAYIYQQQDILKALNA